MLLCLSMKLHHRGNGREGQDPTGIFRERDRGADLVSGLTVCFTSFPPNSFPESDSTQPESYFTASLKRWNVLSLTSSWNTITRYRFIAFSTPGPEPGSEMRGILRTLSSLTLEACWPTLLRLWSKKGLLQLLFQQDRISALRRVLGGHLV